MWIQWNVGKLASHSQNFLLDFKLKFVYSILYIYSCILFWKLHTMVTRYIKLNWSSGKITYALRRKISFHGEALAQSFISGERPYLCLSFVISHTVWQLWENSRGSSSPFLVPSLFSPIIYSCQCAPKSKSVLF